VWQGAMTEEYQYIMKNDVWDIVLRPKGKSVVTSKWIYKIKHAANGSVEKYKARFVARRFSHVEGIDYEETFYPIAQIHFLYVITYSSPVQKALLLNESVNWLLNLR
jgi:hypothetical protein